jgi:hypothetical protein
MTLAVPKFNETFIPILKVLESSEELHYEDMKRRVEGLPMALAGELDYDAITDSVSSKSDDVSAERAVRRYLAIANNLVSSAAGGDFPSRDYFKLT